MPRAFTRYFRASAATSIGLAACAGEPDAVAAYATLAVEVRAAVDAQAPPRLQLALLWTDASAAYRDPAVLPGLESQPIGLGAGVLALGEPVPAAALGPERDGENRVASGGLVAYQDLDRDGRFTPTHLADDGFGDRVVGWAVSHRARYREFADDGGAAGLSIERLQAGEASGVEAITLDAAETVPIDLLLDPAVSCFGLELLPEIVPWPLAEELADLAERAGLAGDGALRPLQQTVRACPSGELPDGWAAIECVPGDNTGQRYRVQVLRAPAAPALRELCGDAAEWCELERLAPPAGWPTCGATR